MHIRYCLLATSLLAGAVSPLAGQDPEPQRGVVRRPWVRLEPPFRRPMLETYRFRVTPERMGTAERALERARLRSQTLTSDRLQRIRDRELAVRGRLSERMSAGFRRSLIERERALDRVRERLDRVRDEQWLVRRRWRRI